MKRSCNELGVCQKRDPRCNGCHAYAPGVIEGPYPNEGRVKALQKWLLRFAMFAGLLAGASFVAGYLS